MHVKLKVLRGASAGKEVEVRGAKFFIGRAEDCHLRANSDAISRRHCVITVTDDQIAVRDLRSRNGTQINGEKISGVHELKMGDQLRVGPLEFLVTYVRAIKPKSAPVGDAPDDDMAGLIDDWLAEGEDSKTTQIMSSETREFRFDETDRIDVTTQAKTADEAKSKSDEVNAGEAKTDGAKTDGAKAAASSQVHEEKDDSDKDKKPHVLPTARSGKGKQAPKDTQEAAAQTLRKFFNRGG